VIIIVVDVIINFDAGDNSDQVIHDVRLSLSVLTYFGCQSVNQSVGINQAKAGGVCRRRGFSYGINHRRLD
jgi:hypothetical protein